MSQISMELVEELAVLLDRQSEHLKSVLRLLDELRKALIRRDLPVLQEMQEELVREAEVRLQLDQSMQILQRKLGGILGCPPQEVCLSLVCRAFGSPAEDMIRSRQQRLTEQVRRLRQQHLATELLLREYTRMNRRLLEILTGRGGKGMIYDSRGRSSWRVQTDLMNVKL